MYSLDDQRGPIDSRNLEIPEFLLSANLVESRRNYFKYDSNRDQINYYIVNSRNSRNNTNSQHQQKQHQNLLSSSMANYTTLGAKLNNDDYEFAQVINNVKLSSNVDTRISSSSRTITLENCGRDNRSPVMMIVYDNEEVDDDDDDDTSRHNQHNYEDLSLRLDHIEDDEKANAEESNEESSVDQQQISYV